MTEQGFDRLRRAMVSNQLRTHGVADAAVLFAMETTPRENFVGDGQGTLAYRDTIVPLEPGRGLNLPAATGRLLAAAQPSAGEKALVIGAGTGYSAAVLAVLGCHVTALEESPTLVARAKAALAGSSVSVVSGPLIIGWAAAAPFDLILIDGAVEHVPDVIIDQLATDGRLVGAVLDRGVTRLAIGRRTESAFVMTSFADVEVAPLPGFAAAPAFAF